MIGIGTDVVEVDRFREAMARRPGLAERVFRDEERRYAEERTDPTERYAVRFAAKEAVMKALGVGLGSFALRDVEVVKAPSGAPSLVLHGRAAEVAAERGVSSWLVTLSHSERSAVAVAVAL